MRSTTLHLPRRNYRVDFRRDYKQILWDARAFCNGARRGMDKTRVSTRDEVLSSSTQREARRESQRRRPLTTAMIVVHSSGDNAAGVVTLARASWFRESRWTIGPTHLSQYLAASWNLIHLSHLLSNHRSRWHSLVLCPKQKSSNLTCSFIFSFCSFLAFSKFLILYAYSIQILTLLQPFGLFKTEEYFSNINKYFRSPNETW